MIKGKRISIGQWIRVILSLGIIGYGVWASNWIGMLGFVTLFTALSGTCPLTLRFPGRH